MNITDYFNVDVCNFASYDNYRKIGSVIDGLKPSSRKCIYTVIKNNVSAPKKVSILKSDAAAQTQYLHGDQSLEGVIVSLAQDFIGSNNIPLLKREGAFGTRLIPEAAAGRYIFTCKEDYLDKIFRKEDDPILIEQNFEGDVIEPKYFVPVLPMLLVNGSIGLTTGFSQKILQHNPKDLISYIEAKFKGKKELPKIKPWFNKFNGVVEKSKDKGEGSWLIKGRVDKVSSTEIEITEVPVNYTLESYTEVLDKLEDEKQIKEYKDLSDDGKFKFKVKLSRLDQGIRADDADILEKLKLVTSVTENYTSFDENNKVVEYKTIYELLDHYYDIRLSYYQKRKEWMMADLARKIKESISKYVFINGVITNAIIIAKKEDEQIIKQLEKTEKIIKVNDSYDYLLSMPMRSMTKTHLDKLKEQIKNMKTELDGLRSITVEEMWQKDLNEFKKAYFK